MAEISIGKPYEQIERDGYFLRVFSGSVDETELIWHKDKLVRLITVVQSSDWQFQFEDQLPFKLIDGMIFTIPHETYHRLIKGYGSLVLKIRE